MGHEDKTKKQLIDELAQMRRRIPELEKSEVACRLAQERLRDSRELIETVFNSIADSISVIDTTNFEIVRVNRAFLDTVKMEEKDVIGKTCYEVTHRRSKPCEPPNDICPLSETLRTGYHALAEHIHYDKDGRKIYVEVSTSTIRNEKGEIHQVVHIARDITERKRLDEELRRMSKVFTDSSDPIIIEDLAGNIISMNDEAERVYGWTREELLGRPINTIIPAEHHRGADELRSRVKQGEQVRNVERLRHNKSGNVFPILLTLSPLTDEKGNPAGMATIAKDLSDIKEMEERLVRSERLAVLGQLAGGVGHELRNPLGVIKNAAYFLNMVLEEPEPEVKETLELLEKEVATSERIISSLLDFARTKAPARQKADINDVVQEALSRIAIPENVELVIRLDKALPTTMSDPGQLSQVFSNIILNAVQAMPEGGRLVVKSEVVPAEWLVVSFTDTGAGIPEENREKVFEPLFTTKAKGIGLGLALTRILVEAGGGTIEVESEVDQGSTFTVRLPIRRDEGQ